MVSQPRLIILLTAGAFVACGGEGTEPVPPVPTTLSIVDAGDLSDTVRALSDTVVVRLTDQNAQPIAGASVRFDIRNELSVSRELSFGEGPQHVVTTTVATQQDGRASAVVRRGQDAGEATLTVSHGALRDSVTYMTLPGTPVRIEAEPADTLLYFDADYVPRVSVLDQFFNVTSATHSFTFPKPGSFTAEGPTVHPQDFGDAPIVATYGELADTIWATVIPRGTIAAPLSETQILIVELNGTRLDTLSIAPCSQGWLFGGLRWAPGGNELVYHDWMGPSGAEIAIHVVELDGDCRRVSEPTAWHTNPAFSPDREWIYLNVNGGGSEVWRMRPDGSELMLIGPDATGTERDIWPQVSPDGETLSFWTTRAPGGLGLVDLATGGFTLVPVQAEAPRWSPRGDLIAYIRDARLRVANVDMSNERMLGNVDVEPSRHQYYDWSPDGDWIIRTARPNPGMVLIRVSDGLMIPLPYLAGLGDPTWRPCPGPFCAP
jgi:hypothetical protein